MDRALNVARGELQKTQADEKAEARPEAELSAGDRGALDAFRANVRRFVEDGPSLPSREYPWVPFCMAKRGTKRVLEYARLAMGFANVRASRYGIR